MKSGPGRAFVDAEERGLDVERVLLRLQEEHVGAALEEARRLLGVGGRHLLEGDAARDRDGLRARAHRAGDEARAVGRLAARARLAREPRRRGVDLAHLVLQAVLAEHDARAAEGVGLDDVRAGGEVALVHLADHVGAGEDQVLVAALVLGAAEVPGGEIATLDVRPGRAVEDDDALGEEGAQTVAAGGGAHWSRMITSALRSAKHGRRRAASTIMTTGGAISGAAAGPRRRPPETPCSGGRRRRALTPD